VTSGADWWLAALILTLASIVALQRLEVVPQYAEEPAAQWVMSGLLV
jgi:hypothetical protein